MAETTFNKKFPGLEEAVCCAEYFCATCFGQIFVVMCERPSLQDEVILKCANENCPDQQEMVVDEKTKYFLSTPNKEFHNISFSFRQLGEG